jgi:hypothetical protein
MYSSTTDVLSNVAGCIHAAACCGSSSCSAAAVSMVVLPTAAAVMVPLVVMLTSFLGVTSVTHTAAVCH